MASLSFTEELEVTAMKSSEGEKVPLIEPIITAAARGQVEKWLLELEFSMKKSVHNTIAESIKAYMKKERHQWVLEWPGQGVIYLHIYFCCCCYVYPS